MKGFTSSATLCLKVRGAIAVMPVSQTVTGSLLTFQTREGETIVVVRTRTTADLEGSRRPKNSFKPLTKTD